MSLALMNRRDHFLRFLTFERAAASDLERWRRSFNWFLRKVTYAQQTEVHGSRALAAKPLLIKSPVQTARIPILLRLFPAAKFVFIHRDPLEVCDSWPES